jgi:crotonobetainyl-CoA:carnitine CoA-transferase CaiB-like acyl-CoA transferase
MGCALEGLLVLDFSRAVAGPFCGMLLGDRGARVIKIEDPKGGDESRGWGPVYAAGESAYFLSLNRNKESLGLDLKSPEARAFLDEAIPKADILIENFRPQAAARLGLSYEQTRKKNPRLIHATISGFGTKGPEAERPGYDLIVQAMSGLMYANRHEDGAPHRVAFPVTDILTGLYANQAILTALLSRAANSGAGRHVEVVLMDCLQAALCSLGPMYLVSGQEPVIGSAIVPYHTFLCADGRVVIGAPNERIWVRFAKAVGRERWLTDPRFANNQTRVDNKPFVLQEIQEAVIGMTRAEILALLDDAEVPCGPIHTVAEAYGSPRAYVGEFDHPTAGKVKVSRNPIRGLEEVEPMHPAPTLGQHTDAILREFGLKKD